LPPAVQPQTQQQAQPQHRPAQQQRAPKTHTDEHRPPGEYRQHAQKQHGKPAPKPQQNNNAQAPKAAGHDASKLPAFLMRPVKLPEKPTPRTRTKKEDAEG
jgi:hypothetical protein